MVAIWDVRNSFSDHFALRARLLLHPIRCHGRYLWGRRALSLSLIAPEEFRLVEI